MHLNLPSQRATAFWLAVVVTSAALLTHISHAAAELADLVALTGVSVETMGTAGKLERATIVIQGEQIKDVGPEVDVPDRSRIMELDGCTVMPGLIDPYYPIRVSSRGTATSTSLSRGRGRGVRGGTGRSSSSRYTVVAENFYPYDLDFRPLLRSGVTVLNLTAAGHGRAALAYNTPNAPEDMLFDHNGAAFATVTNATSSLDVIRDGLRSAQRSGAQRSGAQRSGARRSAGGPRGRSSDRGSTSGSGGRRNSNRLSAAEQKLWTQVAGGERRLVVNAENAAAILHLLAALKKHRDIKLTVIATGPNIFHTLDNLNQRDLSLILRPAIDEKPNTTERICVPRLVHDAGIPFAFSLSLSSSQLGASQDTPLLRLAYMIKMGVPRDVALAAVTTTPARLLGIEDSHGSVEKGKIANLLVFDGDPLDPGTQLQNVFVAGELIYENE